MAQPESDSIVFEELFNKYRTRFIRFAQNYVHDAPIAEDFVMEAFVYYWENRNRLENERNIPAYILTVIKHKCLNYLQHLQLETNVAEDMAIRAQWELDIRISTLKACDPYDIFSAETKEMVNKALSELPEKTKRVFLMSRLENKSNMQIATELGISAKGVEFHITKALKKLRISLKDYYPLLFLFLG
ncbi:RNA polymerase sigma-70 factor [uncultured Bacteroides sp.]|uniref:RNA polymerase sigma-70 factor n=1 Tax=uncultured Bacteroides sp. TaxID=162156 RepID=UPI002AA8B79D|nr:RNA polymerase sigma-70 factor [uncultured Bacteroides sp.]